MTIIISKDCRSFKMLADKQNLSEERKKISSTMCHVLWYVFTFIKCNIINYHNTPAFVIIQHLVSARGWIWAQIQRSAHVREKLSSFGDVNVSAGSFLEKMALGRVSWLEYHFLQHQRISTGIINTCCSHDIFLRTEHISDSSVQKCLRFGLFTCNENGKLKFKPGLTGRYMDIFSLWLIEL